MNIYTIYAPFLLLCVFCLCLSVFADFIFTSSRTCNWKMLRGHVDQESLQRRSQMTQHRQNPRPKLKHQRSTKCSGPGANGPGWTDPTMGYPWAHHNPWREVHDRACLGSRGFSVFFRDSLFSNGFCRFAFIIWCIWTLWGWIQPHSTLLSSPLALE